MTNLEVRRFFKKPGGAILAAALLVAGSATAAPQDYPNRPLRLVTPVLAGGGADATVRMLANKLAEAFNQRVVVDNRPGASNIIGTDIVAKATPDGYTILWVSSTHAINAGVRRGKLPFDPLNDFEPITLFARIPFILVVHPTLPVKSVPELLALARAKPGQLNYASAGIGSTSHFAGELLKNLAKIDLTHVAYKGSAALVAVVGGETPILFTGPLSVLPHARAGRLRPLAVSTARRSPAFPELPTVAEGGAPGYEYTSWYGLLAPRRTPAAIIDVLSGAVAQALKTKEVAAFLTNEGFELDGNGAAAFRTFLASEVAKYIGLTPTIAGLQLD
jgi:tripartite-type tricarboxylate transporter receptor subunit TctC